MIKIASALVKAQKEFAPALKTNTNPHFKSKYVGLDGCIEAVIDALNNNGIALIQKPHECENGVKIETIFLHETGEMFSGGILHVPASKNDAQGYGSALTYARRYGLMAACGIAPEDDDGNGASKAKNTGASAPIVPTTGAWESLSIDEQTFLRDIADEVIKFIEDEDISGAVYFIESKTLDADEKVALWTRFDSKQRSAMKRESEARKNKPQGE